MKIESFCLILLICLMSCGGVFEMLPQPSEEGSNTFGLKIDGKKWVARTHFLGPPALVGRYYKDHQTLIIEASNTSKNERVILVIENLSSVGVHQFSHLPFQSELISEPLICGNNTRFEAERTSCEGIFSVLDTANNQVDITKFDTVSNIIAGNFELDLSDTEGAIKEFRAGRFDLKIE